eukprot:g13096.t1
MKKIQKYNIIVVLILAICSIHSSLGNNNKKKNDQIYQPQLLEGYIKLKTLHFNHIRNPKKNIHLDGYVIELIYDQPLFIHYGNKKLPLDKVASNMLNDFVSMKCNIKKKHEVSISLGTKSDKYYFIDIRNLTPQNSNNSKANATITGMIDIPTYLNYMESFERLDESNTFYFWFSTNRGGDHDVNILGNFHQIPIESHMINLNMRKDDRIKFTSEIIDAMIYDNEDDLISNTTNDTKTSSKNNSKIVNDYCFDPSLASALTEMESDSTANVMSTVMGGLVKTVVEGAIDLLWKPMTEQVEFRDGSNVEDDLVGKVETNNNAEVPQQIATMLDAALTYNLTNLLTDSVTAAVAPRVAVSLSESAGFQIKNVMYEHAKDKASSMITRIVKPTIQARLIKSIPRMVTGSLLARLSNTLTRSITHAILPTVSRGATQDDAQLFYCFQCYHYRKYCNNCHYSASNSYYNVYYSAYYADYFSDYYGKYYTLALDQLKFRWCRNGKCKPKKSPDDA